MGQVAVLSSGAVPSVGAAAPKSIFDGRIVEVDINFPNQAPINFISNEKNPIAIKAVGTKYGSAAQNQCDLTIYNLTKQLQNQIVTATSPLITPQTSKARQLITVNLKVGRVSYGTFLLFTGNVISGGVTQPPDIGVTLRSLTGNFFNGMLLGITEPANTLLSVISQKIANMYTPALNLNFLAQDKQIDNFSYSGSLGNIIKELEVMGNVQAWIDNGTLVVINANGVTPGNPVMISQVTGMVGVPQATEQGVIVTTMINPAITLGCSVQINSAINPSVNGIYKVFKINYEIATREAPFYYILELSNRGYYDGSLP